MSNQTTGISQLDMFLTKAFNLKNGSFDGSQVFELDFNQSEDVPWGAHNQIIVTIPKGISFDSNTSSQESNQTLILETESDYDYQYSASLDAEYSGLKFSGAVHSKYMYHGNLFQSSRSVYALNTKSVELAHFRRNAGSNELTSQFENDVNRLPRNDSGKESYFQFFDKYGTHYLEFGTLGGQIGVETRVNEELFRSTSTEQISDAVEAGFHSILRSGKMDASFAYEDSHFLQQHRQEIDIEIHSMGGLYANDQPVSKWEDSCYEHPSLILNVPNIVHDYSRLKSISELVTDQTKKRLIKELLFEYVIFNGDTSRVISGGGRLLTNEVYKAKNDSFLLGNLNAKEGKRGELILKVDDKSDPESGLSMCSQHFDNSEQVFSSGASALVQKDKYYNADSADPSSEEYSAEAYIYNIGNPLKSYLGRSENVIYGPKMDSAPGFLIFKVDWGNEKGASSQARAYLTINNKKHLVAATSQHRYWEDNVHVPFNSFCLPVPNDAIASIEGGNGFSQCEWISYGNDITVHNLEQRSPDTTYHASTDGFLVAHASTDGQQGNGQAEVKVADNKDELDNSYPLCTSVQNQGPHRIPDTTITVPVKKGQYYKGVIANRWGTCNLKMHWFPIVRKV